MTTSNTIGDIKFFLETSTEQLIKPADVEVDGYLLLRDPGFETAVLISLFSEARARDEDTLPNSDDTRSGWWGSELLESELGSRLWILGRSNTTGAVLTNMEQYIRESLQWMIEDGAADAIEAAATKDPDDLNRVLFTVKIIRRDNNNIFFRFFANWKYQIFGGL